MKQIVFISLEIKGVVYSKLRNNVKFSSSEIQSDMSYCHLFSLTLLMTPQSSFLSNINIS